MSLGDTEIVRDILDNYAPRYYMKSMIFAIQKNRDSMYYYLNKISRPNSANGINNYPEYDEYRNEPRFKEYLEKHYLPITK